MIPTKEQTQWLWEQCGFKPRLVWSDPSDIVPRHQFKVWDYPDGSGVTQNLSINPPIDLNNLFKYAVPKVMEYHKSQSFIGYLQTSTWLMESWVSDWIDSNNSYDPALALFWAIYKALGGEEEPDLYAEVLAEDYGSGGNSEE